MQKKAVVLLGFGGPKNLSDVPHFLNELFSDPNIIPLPKIFRKLVASVIVKRKTKSTTQHYREIGGKSPYKEETETQRVALEKALGKYYRVFTAMRYGNPSIKDAYEEILTFKPEEIILLPLYPQFSFTTTRSSFMAWHGHNENGHARRTIKICCYPGMKELANFYADTVRKTLRRHKNQNFRFLFSAHSIPVRIERAGDPYVEHIHTTAKAICHAIKEKGVSCDDARVCYQSAEKGFIKWKTPSLLDEIKEAGVDGKDIIVVPLSFVSENVETAFELDVEAKAFAKKQGIKKFLRLKTPGNHPLFIEGLKKIVMQADRQPKHCSLNISGCWRCKGQAM